MKNHSKINTTPQKLRVICRTRLLIEHFVPKRLGHPAHRLSSPTHPTIPTKNSDTIPTTPFFQPIASDLGKHVADSVPSINPTHFP